MFDHIHIETRDLILVLFELIAGKAAQKVNVPVPEGCTDPNANANANATNFDPTPRSDDGSCLYK
ncbi:UNVERIFIED_CONTAM: Ribulose bisphosphate carboxylase/oxygenase activase 1, chloroplastic [Sesamum angustifolium]|uniref:Ribulose bisphosphate carboxylase/oxygenase activase 1, chloroplastic n=1 Tax=Sesamum angustifolium TaxID=2727405 RepID=A0AAW2PTN8_9LAMI